MKEVYKNIFMGDVILPKSPLKALNLYLIKGDDRAIVIDSGFDHEESEQSFFSNLDELGVEKGKVDMYLTHLHADHSGLAYKFQQRYGGKVYSTLLESDYINSMANHDYFTTHQFQPELLGLENDGNFFAGHPAVLYGPKGQINFEFVKPGEYIEIVDYKFEILSIPGHTPDHTALYEANHGLLFSGDHILEKITSNISFWRFEFGDILGTYLKNLDMIDNMNVKMVFPSHRTLITDCKRRIEELKKHHSDRLDDIKRILSNGEKKTVVEVASKMHWDFRAKDFDSFPKNQKWFATGEAMAHLEHLRAKGLVDMIYVDELTPILYYWKF